MSGEQTRALAGPMADDFERALAACLAARYGGPDKISEAVRYVMSNGGKRVRPVLCLLAAEAVGVDHRIALPAALALEFVHTYSLVHDDLPCMDDDDLRRGKPTPHKVFGDAQALLAGDALLTDAFAILSEEQADFGPPLSAAARLALVRELAQSAGGAGMVLGQSLDLYWTSRQGFRRQDLDDIHSRKTGFLLGAAASMGAIAGGAAPSVVTGFRDFGRYLGLAFQILDDVLDDSAATGKSRGKDHAAGKLTYLSLMSAEEARQAAAAETQRALDALAATGATSERLVNFARALLERTY